MNKEDLNITLEDIERPENVDYYSLRLLDGNLGHELKREGRQKFLAHYRENIEQYREELSHTNFCFLLAMLKYVDPSFEYDSSLRTEKYILPQLDYGTLIDGTFTIEELIEDYSETFVERGFLYEGDKAWRT